MLQLMQSRDIPDFETLHARIIAATGQSYPSSEIRSYAVGTVQPIPLEFVQDLTATLDLDTDTQTDLAEQYTFHSRPGS